MPTTYSRKMQSEHQLNFPFDGGIDSAEQLALWTPRDIWRRLDQRLMGLLGEDRRVDYKQAERKVDFDTLATYLSAFSNTPDGGVFIFGADSQGTPTGCSRLPNTILNRIEACHVKLCPLARPDPRRFDVKIGGKPDYCIAIYIPYIGRLVETNKGEAWARFGDQRHKMSEEEKKDYRTTRNESSFELEDANCEWPRDFDTKIIEDYCRAFRERENRSDWSTKDILIDRNLARRKEGSFSPQNNLVLLAGKNPGRHIPGCRIRVQRFIENAEGFNPIRAKWIEGNVPTIIVETEKVVRELIFDVTWMDAHNKFVTAPEYPQWAWFEAVVNACVHRSYAFSGTEISVTFFPDRLEIDSPGGFVPPVTEKNIYSARAARNHHLMDAMRYLGYVRMSREGALRIRSTMIESGLPDPVFTQESLHGVMVRVTLKNDNLRRKQSTDGDVADFVGVDAWKALSTHEVAILTFAFRNKRIQVSEAVRLTGRTWRTTKRDLEKLTARRLLKHMPGAYKFDPSAHYAIGDGRHDGK